MSEHHHDDDHDHPHRPLTNGDEPAAAARVQALVARLDERDVFGR